MSDRAKAVSPPRAHAPVRERQPQGEHKCTVCGGVFDTEDDLQRHQVLRHASAPNS